MYIYVYINCIFKYVYLYVHIYVYTHIYLYIETVSLKQQKVSKNDGSACFYFCQSPYCQV